VAAVMPVPQLAQSPTEDIDAIAYRQGYAEGFEAGEQDGQREMEQRRSELEVLARETLQAELVVLGERERRLVALTEGLEQSLRLHEQSMQELAFELGLAALQQVFLPSDDERPILERLCQRMAWDHRGKALHLAVSPDDRALLPERIDGLEVVESQALPAGSCRVVTESGDTESSIAVRLAAIYDSMIQTLGVPR
jgi:flagellar biosynthesis/type III secretory pathway protein FliH